MHSPIDVTMVHTITHICNNNQDYCCGAATYCKDNPLNDLEPGTIEGPSVLFDSSKFIPLDPSQELIFPPALKV